MSDMTVGKLKELLEGLPDSMRVCSSCDPEGNRYYNSIDPGVCRFDFAYSEPVDDDEYDDEDEDEEEYIETLALVIWPSYGSK